MESGKHIYMSVFFIVVAVRLLLLSVVFFVIIIIIILCISSLELHVGCSYRFSLCMHMYMYMYVGSYGEFINPRRACAARVTVVVLSFCLSVSLSVCYHVFCHYEQQDGQ